MAAPKTVKTYDLNGTLKDFPITFEYLARKFVTVTLIGTDRQELVLNTDFRFSTPTQITTMRTAAWGPGDGYDLIEIRRLTSATDRLVDFADGSILRAFDLNTSQIQSLHIAEEARDLTADTIGVNDEGNLDARAKRIVNVADPVDPGDAVTLRFEQDWAASTLNNKIASETARDIALGARDTTLTYRDAAGLHAANANDSAIASESSKVLSTSAKVASEAARDAALGYRDTAGAHASTATTQAGIATTQAGLSATAKTASEAARDVAVNASTQVQYGTVPLFSVQWWGGKRSNIPAGYIPGDGQAISRATYTDVTANVVAMMGTITDASWTATPTLRGNWATGDGSTTWRVPDLNGKSAGTVGAPFLRGDGTLSAAVAGTIQMDAFQDHTHFITPDGAAFINSGVAFGAAGTQSLPIVNTAALTGGKTSLASIASSSYRTASETRPLNVTGCFIIKVFGAVNNTGSVDAMQLATDIGNTNARVTVLEATEKKVYASYRIGPGHINPTSPVNIHWSEVTVATAGGITYTGVGSNRALKVPVNGVYKVTVTLLSGAVNTGASLRVYRAGSLLSTPFATYGAVSAGTMHGQVLIRLNADDEVNVVVTAGQILNDGINHYNAFIIERIDN